MISNSNNCGSFNIERLRGLPLLRTLSVPNCRLSFGLETLPVIVPQLQHLNLSNNQLSGSIDGFVLPQLETLDLSFNSLSGQIAAFPSLKSLFLQHNRLTGDLSVLRSLGLTSLDLSSNLFTTLPNLAYVANSTEPSALSRSLIYCHLGDLCYRNITFLPPVCTSGRSLTLCSTASDLPQYPVAASFATGHSSNLTIAIEVVFSFLVLALVVLVWRKVSTSRVTHKSRTKRPFELVDGMDAWDTRLDRMVVRVPPSSGQGTSDLYLVLE
ncbi:hypothetical protein HDV03_002224 [Kappamyces sp. JEL0829]|nr:hypothetical protein HDV03_002224 [Kappamyces sp. JEL0829]